MFLLSCTQNSKSYLSNLSLCHKVIRNCLSCQQPIVIKMFIVTSSSVNIQSSDRYWPMLTFFCFLRFSNACSVFLLVLLLWDLDWWQALSFVRAWLLCFFSRKTSVFHSYGKRNNSAIQQIWLTRYFDQSYIQLHCLLIYIVYVLEHCRSDVEKKQILM